MDMDNLAFLITALTALLLINCVIDNSMDSFIMCGTFLLVSIVRGYKFCQNQKNQKPEK